MSDFDANIPCQFDAVFIREHGARTAKICRRSLLRIALRCLCVCAKNTLAIVNKKIRIQTRKDSRAKNSPTNDVGPTQ